MLFKIILSIDNWLRACEDNVAVVHCVGGKGRTGTVIACYLLYCGMFKEIPEITQYINYELTKEFSKKEVNGQAIVYEKHSPYLKRLTWEHNGDSTFDFSCIPSKFKVS